MSLTVDTVKVTDETSVKNVLKAFENLAKGVQTLLKSEKAKLDALSSKITELKKVVEPEKEASLEITVEGVNVTLKGHATCDLTKGLQFMINDSQRMPCYFNDVNVDENRDFNFTFDFSNGLSGKTPTGEYTVVINLDKSNTAISKTFNFVVQVDPKEETIEEFKTKNKAVLQLTVETVKVENEATVKAALKAFNELGEDVQGMLNNEKTLLEALSKKIEELKKSTTPDDEDLSKIKSTLTEKIKEATAAHDKVTEYGSDYTDDDPSGQYKEGDYPEMYVNGSKERFLKVIKEVQSVLNNTSSTKEQLNKAIESLNAATIKFNTKVGKAEVQSNKIEGDAINLRVGEGAILTVTLSENEKLEVYDKLEEYIGEKEGYKTIGEAILSQNTVKINGDKAGKATLYIFIKDAEGYIIKSVYYTVTIS